MEISRSESYQFFLEEREYENRMYDRVMNATREELAVYLTSSIEEERWLAKCRLKDLTNS